MCRTGGDELSGRPPLPPDRSPARGALPPLCAATASDAGGGQLIGPGVTGGLRGAPKRADPAPGDPDAATGRRVRALSRERASARFGLPDAA